MTALGTSETSAGRGHGWKVVTAYFTVTYWLPMVANGLFRDHVVSIYQIYPLTLYSALVPVLTYVIFLLLYLPNTRFLRAVNAPLIAAWVGTIGRAYLKFRLFLAIGGIGVALLGFMNGWNTYRYSSVGISQVDSPLLLLFIIYPVIIAVDFMYNIFMLEPNRTARTGSRRYIENVLLAVVFVIAADGTGTMFLALMACCYSLAPDLFRRLIVARRRRSVLGRTLSVLSSVTILAVLFGISWTMGEAIKNSSAGFAIMADDKALNNYPYYFTERISIYYYSLLFTVSAPRDVLTNGELSPLVYPLRTFYFRADYMLLQGLLDVPRPQIGSIAQLNYYLLSINPTRSREGSSPGMLASFNYVFGLPWSMLVSGIYLRAIARMVDVLLKNQRRTGISIIGYILLLAFIQIVFQSPFDLLSIFDIGSIYVVLLAALFLHEYSERSGGARVAYISARPGELLDLHVSTPPGSRALCKRFVVVARGLLLRQGAS